MATRKHSKRRQPRRAPTTAHPSGVLPRPSVADLDPEDPTQELDELGEFHIELAVEAQPSAEAQEELDVAEAEETAEERDTAETEAAAEVQDARKDVGELYGLHLPPSDDNNMTAPEDQDAYQDASLGESYLEALEEHAT
jgi:hypothetical protein